jgi:antitoxin component YwqK of YwqJK toxin-antitoxin module
MRRKIVFLIAFFWTTIGMSQEISKDLYLKRSLRQDNQHFQFKVLESTFGNGHAYKQHKFYYWFKSQTVVCTQGAASGQLLHGLFESFYDNKQLSSKGIFDKGLKHGVWTYWNQKGIIVKIETWDYGVKRGDEKHYDDHGTLLTTVDYGFKNIHRVTKDSIIYTTKEGIYKKVILLDSIGNEVKKIKYKDGMPLREPQGKLREPQGTELKGEDGKTERKKSKDLETKEKESFWKLLFSKKKQDSTKTTWKFWKKKSTKQSR